MNKRKKVRHSKIKNTVLLFECLTRQLTADVLNKTQQSKAMKIIKKRFNEQTELGKELQLYNILLTKKFNSDRKADFLISEVLRHRSLLNNAKLRREKYNIIKEIKGSFDLSKFLSSKINKYKIFASIYNLFENTNNLSPDIKTRSHFNIIEHITTMEKSKRTRRHLHENKDLRILSYKILLEKFNDKYSSLNLKQRTLLKEYINNISNTNLFKEYVQKEIVYIKKALKSYQKNIDDKITKIKLKEATKSIHKFCGIGKKKVVKDSAAIQLMRYYELLKELKKIK